MKINFVQHIYLAAITAIVFAACNKGGVPFPVHNPGEPPLPGVPAETIHIKMQAVVAIGSITYDSIPAHLRITSWDSAGAPHQKDTLLEAGVNIIPINKTHSRFQFSLNKWGIHDVITLNKNEVQQDVVYSLGDSKDPKKLNKEEVFLFLTNFYHPSSRVHYLYNADRLSRVDYYQKKPQSAELRFTQRHHYNYTGTNVIRIDVVDASNYVIGYTNFTYNPQGTKVTRMHQKLYDIETYAKIEHTYPAGTAEIGINYTYNNGNSVQYKMKIKGGNLIEDSASGSTGSSESGKYQYDLNINPFAHMNMPDIFFSNLSKNNLVEQQKIYSGTTPADIVYKHEYTYDDEGYPVEVIRHYKSYRTGEHLYKTKTVYTYQ